MKIFCKILVYIIGIVLIFALLVFYMLSTIQIRDTKDFAEIYVDDIFNYEMMINPPEKYSALNQVDLSIREEVAKYMKENNYILKKGNQEFVRNNPTLDELINDGFVFEEME